ncbi:MAG: hypothetical protein GY847_34505 [Proteobacteria bacterium]|nr:hypothetical protein [Pseudomonadota bacterium]
MIITIFNSVNKMINVTTTQIIDSQVHKKSAEIVNTFINAGSDAIEDVLERIKKVTQEEEE